MQTSVVRKRGIPSLDGLRAIAVGGVLVAHCLRLTDYQHAGRLTYFTAPAGEFGVRIFFVISGYLITTLLLRETDRTGGVSLARFYFRRLLRIFPPFYVYLTSVTLLAGAAVIPPLGRTWPAWCYAANFVPASSWYTGHSWTLSMEEQFYITWPFLLSFTGRRGATFGATLTCIAMPVARLAAPHLIKDPWLATNISFDFLAAGCLLALQPAWVRRAVEWTARNAPFLVVLSVLLALAEVRFSTSVIEPLLLQSLEAATIALGLMWCVSHPESGFGRALNARVVRTVGVGSYSIYLWQELFLARDTVAHIGIGFALLGIAGAAAASYMLIERPSQYVRDWIEHQRLATRRFTQASLGMQGSDGA